PRCSRPGQQFGEHPQRATEPSRSFLCRRRVEGRGDKRRLLFSRRDQSARLDDWNGRYTSPRRQPRPLPGLHGEILMMRANQILALAALSILIVSCGGGGKTYSPTATTPPNQQTPDWIFQLGAQPALKTATPSLAASGHAVKRATGNVPVLIDLGTLTPGQTVGP